MSKLTLPIAIGIWSASVEYSLVRFYIWYFTLPSYVDVISNYNNNKAPKKKYFPTSGAQYTILTYPHAKWVLYGLGRNPLT